MRRLPLVAVFVGVIISCGEPIQDHNVVAAQTQSDETLVRRIQGGDSAAIAEAGKSGNKFFVPYLRQELRNRGSNGTSRTARLALARLGDRQQQQEQWCLSMTDYPEMQAFGYIGGWYSIQALQRFLTPQGLIQPSKSRLGRKNEDVSYPPPGYFALKTLPSVVSNPPVKFDPQVAPPEPERSEKTWQDWIAAHKDELSKLQTTGEGVDFSNKACKNGKPTKTQKE